MSETTTLKVTVKAARTVFGKPNGEFTASVGVFEARGKTREEATAKLEHLLANTERHQFTRRYLHTPKGTVFVLYHVPGAWCYDIVHPGQNHPSGCNMSDGDVTPAFEAMKRHWEQMCQDETAVAA